MNYKEVISGGTSLALQQTNTQLAALVQKQPTNRTHETINSKVSPLTVTLNKQQNVYRQTSDLRTSLNVSTADRRLVAER
jgi:hypothetical protein